jgi:hypothetical protein
MFIFLHILIFVVCCLRTKNTRHGTDPEGLALRMEGGMLELLLDLSILGYISYKKQML